jgi:undecaprenyl pyrophosphate phosphatase UppP
VEFSFLLAVPTKLAATGYDLLKNASTFGPNSLVFSPQVSLRLFSSPCSASNFC